MSIALKVLIFVGILAAVALVRFLCERCHGLCVGRKT